MAPIYLGDYVWSGNGLSGVVMQVVSASPGQDCRSVRVVVGVIVAGVLVCMRWPLASWTVLLLQLLLLLFALNRLLGLHGWCTCCKGGSGGSDSGRRTSSGGRGGASCGTGGASAAAATAGLRTRCQLWTVLRVVLL